MRSITAEEHSTDRARYLVGGMVPLRVVHPVDEQDAAEVLLAARDSQEAVIPVGGATMLDIGDAPSRYTLAVATDRLTGIVEYNPGDLTIVVRAGTTLAEVESELRRQNQFLSLQAPYPERATIGGALAANTSGPLRPAYGSARDAVIGTRVALPNGQIARSGGRVVKNVAGYDLSKLFIGSFGTLGIVIEAAFKVFPQPPVSRMIVVTSPDVATATTLALSAAEALPDLLTIAVINVPLGSSMSLEGPSTVILLSGATQAAEEAAREFSSWPGTSAVRLLDELERDRVMLHLRDFPGRATVRLSTRDVQAHAAVAASARVEALMYPTVGTSYVWAPHWVAEDVHAARRNLAAVGGHLAVWHRSPALDLVPTWGEVGPEISLMRAVKGVFDPNRVMSPGRFVGGI